MEFSLNFEDPTFDCHTHPGEIIIPRRKRIAAPDSSQDAHIFRALEGIDPQDVRAIILGQDPTRIQLGRPVALSNRGTSASGRKTTKSIAASLRRIVQVLAAARTGKAARGQRRWLETIDPRYAGWHAGFGAPRGNYLITCATKACCCWILRRHNLAIDQCNRKNIWQTVVRLFFAAHRDCSHR
jgi:hypothetical protein